MDALQNVHGVLKKHIIFNKNELLGMQPFGDC